MYTDGWGVSNRRCGGGSSAEYEFVKFVGIVRFIDAPHPVAKVSPQLLEKQNT